MNKARAIFLDRDGVINVNRTENVRTWDEFEFERGAPEAMARLAKTDFRIVVITNQSGIGRGHMSRATVEAIHTQMNAEITRAGGRIDRMYFCPHVPEDRCACRKPSPQMLLRGRDDLNLNLEASYMVGDWVDDILAARHAGVLPILVQTGRGNAAFEELGAQKITMPQVVQDLAQAVDWILMREFENATL